MRISDHAYLQFVRRSGAIKKLENILMLIKKVWFKNAKKGCIPIQYKVSGWFLFYIIPIYISEEPI